MTKDAFGQYHSKEMNRFCGALKGEVDSLWNKVFLKRSLSADLQLMKGILNAFERRSENDGEALLMSIFDILNGV